MATAPEATVQLHATPPPRTVMLPGLGQIDHSEYLRLNWRGFARLYRRGFPGVPRRVTRAWGKRVVREREQGETRFVQ